MFYAISSGFLVGLLGSFHCIGMCGPIALALPVHKHNTLKKVWYILMYNFGRIFTYSVLGFLFGLLGKGLFIGKYQQYFSIAIGVLMLLALVVPTLFKKADNKYIAQFSAFVRKQLSNLFKKEKSGSVYLTIGIFNGLLPCGLVYFAIASAVGMGNLENTVGFMFMFGLATIPMMFAIAFLGNFISQKFRQTIQRLIPFFIAIMAVLMVLRGLNLGIPYLSPKIEHTEHGTEQSCCHPEE